QWLDRPALGHELGARRHTVEGLHRLVAYMVVDEEQVAARAGSDVTAGAVQGIAVEQHDAARRTCGLFDTVAVDHLPQTVFIGNTEFLAAQGLLVMILRRLANTTDVVLV